MSTASLRYTYLNTAFRQMLAGGNGSPAALNELDSLWPQMTDVERDAVQMPHQPGLQRHLEPVVKPVEVHVAGPARVFVAPGAVLPLDAPGVELPATERAVVAAVERLAEPVDRAIMRGNGDAPEPVAAVKADETPATERAPRNVSAERAAPEVLAKMGRHGKRGR